MASSQQVAGSASHGFDMGPAASRLDGVTNLPLIACPDCKDVSFRAFTVKNRESENFGKRFFKCPRNRQGVCFQLICGFSFLVLVA